MNASEDKMMPLADAVGQFVKAGAHISVGKAPDIETRSGS